MRGSSGALQHQAAPSSTLRNDLVDDPVQQISSVPVGDRVFLVTLVPRPCRAANVRNGDRIAPGALNSQRNDVDGISRDTLCGANKLVERCALSEDPSNQIFCSGGRV